MPNASSRTRRRAHRACSVLATIVVGALVAHVVTDDDEARAAIEGGVYASDEHNVRVSLPRGWRISEQAAYPGVIVRMHRTRPRATMLLAVDPLPARAELSEGCAALSTFAEAVACEQRADLAARGVTVGEVQAAARPWFDYADGKRVLRQGVVVLGPRVFTLVLAADSTSARAQYARSFDRTLRSVRSGGGEATTTSDGGVPAAPLDGGVAAPPDAGP